jgi:hypothetical protein
MTERTMSSVDMARTSNEWMRRYIDEPEKFRAQFRTVSDFLADQAGGKQPTYGDECTAYQFFLLEELNAAT